MKKLLVLISTQIKQMFYCFGCKKGGDIFHLFKKLNMLIFRESLKILAEKAGIAMHDDIPLNYHKKCKKKKSLLQIHEYATQVLPCAYWSTKPPVIRLFERSRHCQATLLKNGESGMRLTDFNN
jgi:DNA primase